MLSTTSLLNLLITLLSLPALRLLDPRSQRLHRPFRLPRQILASRFCIDHQQIERHVGSIVEISYSHAAAFPAALPAPPHLADAARLRDQIAGLGIRAMKSTKASRSSSVHTSAVWRMNTAVSATV